MCVCVCVCVCHAKLNIELWKKLATCYIWSFILYCMAKNAKKIGAEGEW